MKGFLNWITSNKKVRDVLFGSGGSKTNKTFSSGIFGTGGKIASILDDEKKKKKKTLLGA